MPARIVDLATDPACLVALLLGLVWTLVPRASSRLRFTAAQEALVFGAASALLSWAYVEHYLGGSPRVIDATSYWLQARTYAAGELAFAPPGPIHSFTGRFLLPTADGRLSVLFPPGYPALLSLGFWVGAPMLVGPLLGFGISAGTYGLAHHLTASTRVARVAATLATLCAAMRYQSADTMSHGLAALLVLAAVTGALKTFQSRCWGLLGGLSLGWLVATRPLSGLACGLAVGAFLLWSALKPQRPDEPTRAHGWVALMPWLSAFVGVGALVLEQAAVVGRVGLSTQYLYYALADGPPQCFNLGLGTDIGCRYEHGDFVARYMPQGYGLLAAGGTTIRRLALHSWDVANLWGGPWLAACAWWRCRRHARYNLLAVTIALQVLLYALFYFDGNLPGAGARMFADIIPLEHVLLGTLLANTRFARYVGAAACVGFALGPSADHRRLAIREGGEPMFIPERLAQATGDGRGKRLLVYVTTDHGFNLAFDPSPEAQVVVARLRRDALDRVLYEHLGHPPAFVYHFDPSQPGEHGRARPYIPPVDSHFNARSLWPPLAVTSGWVERSDRGLRLHDNATMTVSLPALAPEWTLQTSGSDTSPPRLWANNTELPVSPVHGTSGSFGWSFRLPMATQTGEGAQEVAFTVALPDKPVAPAEVPEVQGFTVSLKTAAHSHAPHRPPPSSP